jgi:superfamily II DNA helicase RecQ
LPSNEQYDHPAPPARRRLDDGPGRLRHHAGARHRPQPRPGDDAGPDERHAVQDRFMSSPHSVVVATIAFGMGIDKSDIRYVYHYNPPKSLENYMQETGRAGRDDGEGNCVAFYSYDDIQKLDKFNKDKPVAEQEIAKELLNETVTYAESSVCRHRLLLHYFGEAFEKLLKHKRVRAGSGKSRGRKYKSNAGLLFVIASDEKMNRAGIEVVKAKELTISDLSPNGEPGRFAIYTEKALKEIDGVWKK